jgi:hypothetical protein
MSNQSDGREATVSLDRPIGMPRPRMRIPSVSHAALFLRVFTFAAAVPYLLRLKLPRVARLIESKRNPPVLDEGSVGRIVSYVEMAIRRGRPLVRPGCLTRGLTRYYFLRRAGMDVTLCFGMGRPEKEIMGHCWLTSNGEPFLELEDPRPRYVEMYRISRAGGRACTPAGASGSRRLVHS